MQRNGTENARRNPQGDDERESPETVPSYLTARELQARVPPQREAAGDKAAGDKAGKGGKPATKPV